MHLDSTKAFLHISRYHGEAEQFCNWNRGAGRTELEIGRLPPMYDQNKKSHFLAKRSWEWVRGIQGREAMLLFITVGFVRVCVG